ncbi:VOC family protein [Gracilibacillus alcaliphilus]
MLTGIDHVQLAAPPGSEPKAFFGNILGMQEVEKPANLKKRGGVWFQCGPQQLHIGIQENFTPAIKAHPAFTVENINLLKERLTEHEVAVKEDELLEGAQRFFVDDRLVIA